jgi:N-acetylglutamate synthase-like GNAT family acetyltransferase
MKVSSNADPRAIVEYYHYEFVISTDPARLDLNVIHGFLANCYWAKGIPRKLVERTIKHSLCFGIYDGQGSQVGFARVVSDFATMAYLDDVFMLVSHRGRGLGKWLVECVMRHPALQGLRHWFLLTRDAHGLYAQFGFKPLKSAGLYMELHRFSDLMDRLAYHVFPYHSRENALPEELARPSSLQTAPSL